MIAKHAKVKALLFDGTQEEMLDRSFSLDTEIAAGGAILFDDFIDNNFEELHELISNDDFNAVIRSGGFTGTEGFPDLYKNEEGLQLYFAKRDNTILVFAYGEFQPTRYKLYLEGIWVVG